MVRWIIRWMCNIGPEDWVSAKQLKTRLKLENMIPHVYKIEDCNDLIIYKEWKRMLGLAKLEPTRLISFPENNLRKNERG